MATKRLVVVETPQEVRISEKVLVRWGLPKGRVEVVAELPWPLPDKTIKLTPKMVPTVMRAIDNAFEWVVTALPQDEDREQRMRISKDLTILWGYTDGHVEAETKYIAKVRLRIEVSEIDLVRDVVSRVVDYLKGRGHVKI